MQDNYGVERPQGQVTEEELMTLAQGVVDGVIQMEEIPAELQENVGMLIQQMQGGGQPQGQLQGGQGQLQGGQGQLQGGQGQLQGQGQFQGQGGQPQQPQMDQNQLIALKDMYIAGEVTKEEIDALPEADKQAFIQILQQEAQA